MESDEVLEKLKEAYFSDHPDEIRVLRQLPKLIGSDGVFIDVGASLGQYSYYVSKLTSNGHIIPVEPDPLRFEELVKNCADWAAASGNRVEAIRGAVSDYDGETTFHVTGTSMSGGLFKHSSDHLSDQEQKEVQWQAIQVPVYTLDAIVKDKLSSRSPDLVKIDVEGSELRVLKGATNLLAGGKTKFLVEVHSWADPEGQSNPAEVYDYFKAAKYSVIRFYGQKLFVRNPLAQHPFLWLRGNIEAAIRVLGRLAGRVLFWRR